MKVIGLTGNIASGKSTVEEIIKNNGYKIIDADCICHEILDNNSNVIEQVKKLFKDFDILDENNKLNRKKIGEIVFSDIKYKTLLEYILHPFIKEEINKFIETNKNESAIFVSVPLLFEAHMEDMFNKIILVAANEEIRLERLIKRNNFTVKQAFDRMNSQIPENLKMLIADYIIDNNSDLENLKINAENILSLINIE